MTPRVERFVYDSAQGLSLVVKKAKSVYVVPPLMKHQAGKHDQSTHGSWAEGFAKGIAEKISQKTASLKDQGVTQEFLTDKKRKADLFVNLENVAISAVESDKKLNPESDLDLDEILYTQEFIMTSRAMDWENDNPEIAFKSVLLTDKGNVAGAMAVSLEGNSNGEDIVEIHYLGTTGIVDGAGSMLYGQAINYAYKNKMGLQLYPLKEAVPFWKEMGFDYDISDSDYLQIPADKVELLWKELTIVESAMPNA
jgi:hypothetical protein